MCLHWLNIIRPWAFLSASWMDERSRDDLLTTKTMKTRDNERQRGRDRKDHHVESTPSNWKSGFIGSWKGSRRRATRKSRCQLVADGRAEFGISQYRMRSHFRLVATCHYGAAAFARRFRGQSWHVMLLIIDQVC